MLVSWAILVLEALMAFPTFASITIHNSLWQGFVHGVSARYIHINKSTLCNLHIDSDHRVHKFTVNMWMLFSCQFWLLSTEAFLILVNCDIFASILNHISHFGWSLWENYTPFSVFWHVKMMWPTKHWRESLAATSVDMYFRCEN